MQSFINHYRDYKLAFYRIILASKCQVKYMHDDLFIAALAVR